MLHTDLENGDVIIIGHVGVKEHLYGFPGKATGFPVRIIFIKFWDRQMGPKTGESGATRLTKGLPYPHSVGFFECWWSVNFPMEFPWKSPSLKKSGWTFNHGLLRG